MHPREPSTWILNFDSESLPYFRCYPNICSISIQTAEVVRPHCHAAYTAHLEHFPVELGEELERGLLEAARPAAASPAGPGCGGAPRVEGADAAEVVGEEGRVPLVEDAVGAREDVVQLPLRVADQLVHELCNE